MHNTAERGFTLLEVMVAIAIFAVIGLGSWQVLERAISSKQVLENRSEQLRQLQRAMWLISRDMQNIVNRPVRNHSGETEPPVSSLIPGYALTLSRSGWHNPLDEPRSSLQRVAYSLEPNDSGNNDLVRYFWAYPDQASGTTPQSQTLLHNVRRLEVNFINSLGEEQFHWPVSQTSLSDNLPAGISLQLETELFGNIYRLFALREVVQPTP